MIALIWIFGIAVISFAICGFGTAGIVHFIVEKILQSKLDSNKYATIAGYGWFAWIVYIGCVFVSILMDSPLCDFPTFIWHQVLIITVCLPFAVYFVNQDNN